MATSKQDLDVVRLLTMKNTFGLDDNVIPIFFPSSLVRWLETEGYEREALIEGTGLDASEIDEPEILVNFRRHRKLIDNALRITNNPHLGLDFGRQLQITSMGIVGYAAMSEKNLGQSLKTITKYIKLRAPLIELNMTTDGDWVNLQIDEALDLGSIRQFFYEAFIMATINMFEGQGMKMPPETCCKLTLQKPDDWDQHKHLLPVPVKFNQTTNSLSIPAKYMDLELKMADPVSASSANKICEEQLRNIEHQEGLISRLRGIIEASLDKPPSLSQAAEHFCVSPRTLRRELEKLGTTYQTLLDQCRQEIAIKYLKSSNLTLQELAVKMGYNDSSNFGRAFRKWTGKPPGEFRK